MSSSSSSSLPALTSLLQQAHIEDHDEILKAANTALKHSKGDLDAQHVKIVALLKLDRFDDAIHAFNGGGDKLKERARLEYAYTLYKIGNPSEAADVAQLGDDRGYKHIAAQASYRTEDFRRAAELYQHLAAQPEDDAEADLRINSGAVDAQLEWAGQGALVLKKKPGRQDLEAYETAYNAACGAIARGELGQGEVLLRRARDLCNALEDLGEEEKRAELLPIGVQQVYVLARQGRSVQAEEMAREVGFEGIADASTRHIAQVNKIAASGAAGNPFMAQRLMAKGLHASEPDHPFRFQTSILHQNKYAVDLRSLKFGGTAESTAEILTKRQSPNLDAYHNNVSVINAAAHAKAHTSLVLDALYLRSHPDTDGSGYLILKYTGRPLQPLHRPATPPALQRNITAFSGIPNLLDTSPSSPSFPGRRQPTNLEAVLQSTARTLYARGGKAVRGAVEEVHKRAQEIQKSPTPSLPSRAEHASRDSRMLERRLRALEKRNQMLAELLEGAVGELWDVQGLLAGPDGAERLQIVEKQREAHVEALSLAIAKVQYVQVYLGDASLPVPEMYAAEDPVEDTGEADSGPLMQSGSEGEERSGPDEVDPTRDDVLGESREHVTPVIKTSPTTTRYDAPAHDLADPSTFEVNSGETTPTNEEPAAAVPEIAVQGPATDDNSSANRSTTAGRTDAAATTSPTPTTTNEELFDTPSKRYRPALSEGSYSWMLGQDKASDSAATSASSPLGKTSALQSTKTPEKAKVGTGLFGNGDGGADGDNDGITVVHSSRRKRSGKQRAVVERLDGDHGELAADRARGAT
ncbi:Signal recognition particle subunit SRP72 [Friedmanniomyces endolithicus]|uniref:Signal recognition particle subunit SRP72 n=1 Tax=Friedmanniomyces endolithicus TaxID=329885 RepID=A0AAN6KGS9_9PEZI|nr:Signal recognition particle subunit SRP72 [Friedmanniomyces endolithicus]